MHGYKYIVALFIAELKQSVKFIEMVKLILLGLNGYEVQAYLRSRKKRISIAQTDTVSLLRFALRNFLPIGTFILMICDS